MRKSSKFSSVKMRTLLTLFTGFILFGGIADSEETQSRQRRVSSSALGPADFDAEEKPRKDRQSNGGKDYDFPIIIPPYNYEKLDYKNFGTCLLYIESIAVVVFATPEQVENKRDFISAAAVINGSDSANKYSFEPDSVQCLDKSNDTIKGRQFYFHIKVNIKDKVVATDGKDSLFYVDKDLDFIMNFKVNLDSSWNLEDIDLKQDLVAEPDGWITKSISAKAGTKSDNAARILFGGFKDYGYACSSTPLIAWSSPNAPTIGLSFNNIQLQGFGTSRFNKSESAVIQRFSTNVNDCVGTFSVGSWMAIVVILVFLGVLAFGFLMLNSVQTMDRFDDPKQKQLIINAKE